MTDPRHDFDEALISGYLDGELTQAEAQQVRVHLEDCDSCRQTAERMRSTKEATMGSQFDIPDDTQWDEAPRGGLSRTLRNIGIVIGLAWLVGIVGYVLVELAGEEDLFGLFFVGGLLVAGGLLLASVIIDRREEQKTDKYRRVKK